MLNLDHDEARALHRIVRAMHDGECPKCHTVHSAASMWKELLIAGDYLRVPNCSGWQCDACGFYITEGEGEQVFKIFAPFMERNLAIFEKWRADRRVPGEA